MRTKPNHKLHLLNPYMFVLALLGAGLILGGSVLGAYFDNFDLRDILIFGLPAFGILFVYTWNGYEYLGFWRLEEQGIRFYSLLRFPFLFPFESIHYLGMDYGYLQGNRDIWIYFSETPIEKKYQNNINRKPFRRRSMRIHYNKKAYDCLVEGLPPELSKKLQRAYSVVRLCRQEE